MRITGLDPHMTYDNAEFDEGTYGATETKEYIFVEASGAIDQYDVVVISESGSAAALTRSNDAYGDRCGVAPVAIADDDFGWVQVMGACTVNAKASCAANVKLYSSATAGHIDDATASSESIEPIALTSARASSDGTAPAMIVSQPSVTS